MKKLGLWTSIALVSGNMIGSGIFLLPASLATIGSISLYSWFITATGALALALLFARLSLQVSNLGGPYAYVKAALGRFLGFQTAYIYWLTIWIGNAAIALAFVSYASVFFPALHQPILAALAAICLVWVLTFVNLLGVYGAGLLDLVTTVIKVMVILMITVLGWRLIHWHYYAAFNVIEPHQDAFSAITMGAALTFWSFIGLESATVPSDSVANPQRTIPLATILGTVLVALVYIASSAVIMGMIPNAQLQHDAAPFATAAKLIFGHFGQSFIALGAMISCLGCLNGWILLQGQIPMAAAQDKLFPKWFAIKNRHGIPVWGMLLTSILISALLLMTVSKSLVAQFKLIILLAVLTALIPYLYTVLAEWVLWRKKGTLRSWSYRLWFVLLMILILYLGWAIIGTGQKVLFYGCLVLLSSVIIYPFIQTSRGEQFHGD